MGEWRAAIAVLELAGLEIVSRVRSYCRNPGRTSLQRFGVTPLLYVNSRSSGAPLSPSRFVGRRPQCHMGTLNNAPVRLSETPSWRAPLLAGAGGLGDRDREDLKRLAVVSLLRSQASCPEQRRECYAERRRVDIRPVLSEARRRGHSPRTLEAVRLEAPRSEMSGN